MKAKTQQINLIETWGFIKVSQGEWNRNAPCGYIEQWKDSSPNEIVFLRDSNISHNHNIDWSLFKV